MPFIDLSRVADPTGELERLVELEAGREFDLTAAPPVSFTLVKITDQRFVLVISSDHIVTDAKSWNIFLRDIAIAYEATVLGLKPSWPRLPIQYSDYVVWQRLIWRRDGPKYQPAIAQSKEQLKRGPILPNIRSFRRYWRQDPAEVSNLKDWFISFGLAPETSRRIDAIGRARKATPYMVRVAAVATVLASLDASDRVVVGTVFTARRRAEFQDIFGLFANVVPLVIEIDRNASFHDLVDHVRIAMLRAHEVADLPFEELAAGLKEQGMVMPSPPFWVHTATPSPPIRVADLEIRKENSAPPMPINGMIAQFDLQREEDHCTLSFDPRLFAKAELHDLVDRLVQFIEHAASNPDAPLRVGA